MHFFTHLHTTGQDANNRRAVYYGCDYLDFGGERCTSGSANGVSGTRCVCNTDYCNAGMSPGVATVLLAVIVPIALLSR